MVDDDVIKNQIVATLIRRINNAKGTKFRVYVVVPLIPALEGDYRLENVEIICSMRD